MKRYKVKHIIILVSLALTLGAVITTLAIVKNNKAQSINKTVFEEYLAEYYTTPIKEDLFKAVLNNRLDLLPILQEELYRSNKAMLNRKSIILPYMSKENRESNKSLEFIMNINLGSSEDEQFINMLKPNTELTEAEINILSHIYTSWLKADEFAFTNNLNVATLASVDKQDRKNSADLVAECSSILGKELKDVPKMFSTFYSNFNNINEINISTDILLGDFYNNEKCINELKKIVRKYTFTKVPDITEYKAKYYIKMYYKNNSRPSRLNPDWFEVAENYIRVEGSFMEVRAEEVKKRKDYDTEGYKQLTKGIYKVDKQFFKDIEQWIKLCEDSLN